MRLFIQFAISVTIGCFCFWLADIPGASPKDTLLAGLIGGFGGLWLVMFLYIWVRYGWRAAKSLSMEP